MVDIPRRVIVCQIGAREHYAVPRKLHRAGLLAELITDVWIPPDSAVRHLPGSAGTRLRGRYHPELIGARVTHFAKSAFCREAFKVVKRPQSRWDAVIGQNQWFQAEAVRHLKATKAFNGDGTKPVVLAYSYAARDIFELARGAGSTTILGQIDGGEADEALIDARWSQYGSSMPNKAPASYWASWREECELADRILVNSEWSKNLLVQAGVEYQKLLVVPVVYECDGNSAYLPHQYPGAFDVARPLRVLFLGAMTLRKGLLEALEAARILVGQPVEFTFVGADAETHAALISQYQNVRWYDRVPRSQVPQFYRDADIFLFPTHSDGFGMTQIEALASGLPVIASRNCGAIIQHGITGLLLNEVSAAAIVHSISTCLDHPEQLVAMSAATLAASKALTVQSSAAFLNAVHEVCYVGV